MQGQGTADVILLLDWSLQKKLFLIFLGLGFFPPALLSKITIAQ